MTFFVFSERPLGRLDLDGSDYGFPIGADLDAFRVVSTSRSDAPGGFDLLKPPIGLWAKQADIDLERLAMTEHRVAVHGTVSDPRDLSYLQAAWALVRCVANQGAVGILDAGPIRWWSPAALEGVPVTADFDISREILVILETLDSDLQSGARGGGVSSGPDQILHTRGMAKFGRPDIIFGQNAELAAGQGAAVLREVAGQLARGLVVSPDVALEVEGFGVFRTRQYIAGGAAPNLELNNAALVIEPA